MEFSGPVLSEDILTEEAKFSVLTEVCSFINSSMPHDEQLLAIVEAANKLLGVKDSSLILMNPNDQRLYFHVATGEKSQEIRQLTLESGEGIAGWVIEHGTPLAVADVSADPRFSSRISQTLHFETHSILCVPIRSDKTVIGAFEAVNRLDGRPFNEKDIPLLTAFVALIKMVLENSRQQREMRDSNQELERLVQDKKTEIDAANKSLTTKTQRLALTTKIVSLINSNQSIPVIWAGVVEHLRRLIHIDYATLSMSKDAPESMLLLELFPTPFQSITEGVRVPFDEPVLNYVLQYKQALFHNRPRWYRCFLEDGRFIEKRLGTMFCTPILSSDTVWGTLNLGGIETRRYPKEVVDIVAFVATQIGVALERDNLRKTLERMNQELNAKTFELRKTIIKMGDANLKLFNTQQELREKDKRMNVLLEEVQQKNSELNSTLTELQQAQTHMVQSEKMASLGQLVAGIAHELNTPAGAIKAASEIIPGHMQKIFQSYEHLLAGNLMAEHRQQIQGLLDSMVESINNQTRKSTAEIREQSRMLVEKFEARGLHNSRQLARDIARCYLSEHADVLLNLFTRYDSDVVMDFLNNANRVLVSARDNLLSIETISKIVRALKAYTYLDQSQERTVDLNEDLENTLTILHSHIPANITVVRQFGELPAITCQGSELNQVWTNVIQNALQALEESGGTVTIDTSADAHHLRVKIIDNGPGIPDDMKAKVFDPFFTTHRGKKRGLGLSIAQQIINRHHGRITIESVPGYTCVEMALPKTGI